MRVDAAGLLHAERGALSLAKKWMSRDQFFAALFVVGCANGFIGRVITAVESVGWWQAVTETFGISVIVWLGCVAGLSLLLQHSNDEIKTTDLIVGLAGFCLFSVPFSPLSWLIVTGLALYVFWVSEFGSSRRRGALIFLAVTVPMFWTRALFAIFGDFILKIDAFFVSAILATERIGNVVAFADGSGYMQVFEGCSSFHNLSLVLVAWVMASQLVAHRRSPADLVWYLLACLSVVAVNVTRVSLIGFYPAHYDIFHGPIGNTAAGWLTLVFIVGFSLFGVRRELFARL